MKRLGILLPDSLPIPWLFIIGLFADKLSDWNRTTITIPLARNCAAS
jgi:hypothetical protein